MELWKLNLKEIGILKIKFERNWNFENLFENWSSENWKLGNYVKMEVLKIGILENYLKMKVSKIKI